MLTSCAFAATQPKAIQPTVLSGVSEVTLCPDNVCRGLMASQANIIGDLIEMHGIMVIDNPLSGKIVIVGEVAIAEVPAVARNGGYCGAFKASFSQTAFSDERMEVTALSGSSERDNLVLSYLSPVHASISTSRMVSELGGALCPRNAFGGQLIT